MPRFAVIIPAAGSSVRFGAPKLIQNLAGLPVIARALLPFIQRSDTHQVLVAVPNEPLGASNAALPAPALAPPLINTPGPLASAQPSGLRPGGRVNEVWEALSSEPSIRNRLGGQVSLVPGGASRAASVRAALRCIPGEIEWIAIHDAARPLLSQDLIDRTLAAAVEYGAAAPALPVRLTIKQTSADTLPAQVKHTVPRSELWAMQTPQIMRRELLQRAFDECVYPLEHITDDLQLLELAGESAWLVAGDEQNIKITTPMDLRLAELLLRK